MPEQFIRTNEAIMYRGLRTVVLAAARTQASPAKMSDIFVLSGFASEVQSLTVAGATGGNVPITMAGQTAILPYNVTATAAQLLLEALSTIKISQLCPEGKDQWSSTKWATRDKHIA